MSYNSPVCVTATRQFSNLNTIPISFFLTSPRSRFCSTRHKFLFTLILLSGDVHMNPGPVSAKFNLCALNIRSLINPVHYTALSDLADTYNIDLLPLVKPGYLLILLLLSSLMLLLLVSLSLVILDLFLVLRSLL
jgi:hypothetical protein